MGGLLLPLVLTTLAPVTPQVPDPPKIGVHIEGGIAFDWSGLSIDGTSHDTPVIRIVFRYVDVATGRIGHRATVHRDMNDPVTAGSHRVPFSEAVMGIPPGRWNLTVRVENTNDSASPFSSPPIEVEVVVPPRPAAVTGVEVQLGAAP